VTVLNFGAMLAEGTPAEIHENPACRPPIWGPADAGAEGINAGYGAAQVLRDLSLSVAAGEILCLLGRNGAGKTTR
jgi:ABC-type branched-subunit amino acid transport system ATPase component